MPRKAIQNDDEDEGIDVESLGDWRAFRKSLVSDTSKSSVAKENENLLMKQNPKLAKEYKNGAWAHPISTPEVGGLVCRLPLEVEIHRNHRHNVIGQLLHKRLDTVRVKKNPTPPQKQRPSAFFEDADNEEDYIEEGEKKTLETVKWYSMAQVVVKEQMCAIADMAEDGAVDSAKLDTESGEMLQLYLDNQDNWQEVCLVLDRDEVRGTATTVTLNRPMARKLNEEVAKLVLFGMFQGKGKVDETRLKTDLVRFLLAFGKDIAIYVGGPDAQDHPALLLHGFRDLEGAVEISPGSGIYKGGLNAAIQSVLEGKNNPLDFRFFVGRHIYTESTLDVDVVLGKYQPIACDRTLCLKQCIALPKPLWHEAMELCGGELKEVSELEMRKRDDLQFQIVEDGEDVIIDDLDELSNFDEEDDDEYII